MFPHTHCAVLHTCQHIKPCVLTQAVREGGTSLQLTIVTSEGSCPLLPTQELWGSFGGGWSSVVLVPAVLEVQSALQTLHFRLDKTASCSMLWVLQ